MLDFKNINMQATQIKERKDLLFPNSINWRIVLNDKVELEYSEGIGRFINTQHHLANKMITQPIIKALKEALKEGRTLKNAISSAYSTNPQIKGLLTRRVYCTKGIITPPKIEDVLYGLTMDACAIELDFEEFCDDYGYDQDSRKALKIYNACRSNYRKLVKLGLNLAELQEHFEDY